MGLIKIFIALPPNKVLLNRRIITKFSHFYILEKKEKKNIAMLSRTSVAFVF